MNYGKAYVRQVKNLLASEEDLMWEVGDFLVLNPISPKQLVDLSTQVRRSIDVLEKRQTAAAFWREKADRGWACWTVYSVFAESDLEYEAARKLLKSKKKGQWVAEDAQAASSLPRQRGTRRSGKARSGKPRVWHFPNTNATFDATFDANRRVVRLVSHAEVSNLRKKQLPDGTWQLEFVVA